MSNTGILRPHISKLVVIYKIADALLILLSYRLSLAFGGIPWSEDDSITVILAISIFFTVGSANSLYRSWRISRMIEEILSIAWSWILTFLIVLVLSAPIGTTDTILRNNLLIWLALTPLSIACWHIVSRIISRELRKRGHNTRSVVIAGYTELGISIADTVNTAAWMGFRLIGFYEDRQPAESRLASDDRYLESLSGNFSDLVELARRSEVDVVYLALPMSAQMRLRHIVDELSDTTTSLYLAQSLEAFNLLSGRPVMLGDIHMLTIHESPFYGIDGWVKRMEDILFCIPILALIALPCLLISVLIKIDSPGPVLFKQKRYGLNGTEIDVWKFRSMYWEKQDENVQQATFNDPRITRLGKFLRRTSLDELPQFINVLKGNMSIVGPRPHAVLHNEQYRKLIGAYMLRHKVKPGITGWAQINGYRGETDRIEKMEKRVEHDLYYIKNWSIALDLKIIALTILHGFTGKNAY